MDEGNTGLTTSVTPICAIGASAGGVRALRDFFSAVPDDLGFAYVVIIHLAPDHPSALSAILAQCTAMPVEQVEDTPTLVPNHVYVIPPDKELVISGNEVKAQPFAMPRGLRAPIDMFFRSVAAARGDGIAVVLSGAGSDGSNGVRKIKEAGGVVFVQEPTEAEYPMMPRSALASGAVDFVAPIPRLVDRIIEVTRSKDAISNLRPEDAEHTLRRIVRFLQARTGHDFSSYKRATVMRRIARRMQVTRRQSLADYADYLATTPEEAQELFADLLISVTTFFRDPDAFRVLSAKAITTIFEEADESGIRAWVAGCATGEEAFSLAMLMLEEAERRRVAIPIQIFASDLDEGALATAREARYPSSIEADVSEERLRRFFVREGTHYRIKKEVRNIVLFATHSVLKDPPFMRLDIITCRNLLIYLEREVQQQVCTLFHYGLKPHGFLFLGSAETVDAAPDLYFAVHRESRLYRARPQASRNLPLFTRMPSEHRPHVPERTQSSGRPQRELSASVAHALALEHSAPPSALVDHEHRILHLSPSAGRFLLAGGGPFTTDLGVLVRPELRLDLRSALRSALDQGEPTLTLPVPTSFEGSRRRVLLQVAPIHAPDDGPPVQAIVFFLDGGPVADGEPAPEGDRSDEALRLREALRSSEARLNSARTEHENAIQDLRIANEELQSINEEYRSTSEELETSKEELQSMNEELQTVNTELKSKLESISTAHSDLQNLVSSTDIGTLFLDPELRIRMFTPRIADLFNITDADSGRSIFDFTHRLTFDDLPSTAQKVLRDLAPVEHEVQSRDGRWFMMRVRPYRTIDDRIDGVVLSFIDATERREAMARLRDSEERFRALVGASSDVVFRMSPDWAELKELIGRGFLDGEAGPQHDWVSTYIPPADQPAVWDAVHTAMRTKAPFELEHRIRRADGTIGWALSRAVPLLDEAGEIREWFGAASDITGRRRGEEDLRMARDLLAMATEASRLGWGTWDFQTREASWDARSREIIGLEENETTAQAWLDRLHPDDRPSVETHVEQSVHGGLPFDMEYRVVHRDGTVRHVHGTGMFQRDEQGQPVRGTGLVRDITDLKNWQASQRLLVGELNHRVKNMLAVVQSIAFQTKRSCTTMEEFVSAFEHRIKALARAHALLTRSNWEGASLRALVGEVVGSFGHDDGVAVVADGPDVALTPNSAITLAMAFHELCTNALKHGALSAVGGNVTLRWRVDYDNQDQDRLNVEWSEHGGPAVTPPRRRGFGRRMLEEGVAHELGGQVRLDYRPEGVVYTMDVPMKGNTRDG